MSYRVRRAKCCRKRVKTRAMETDASFTLRGPRCKPPGALGAERLGRGQGRRGTGFVVGSGFRLEPKV